MEQLTSWHGPFSSDLPFSSCMLRRIQAYEAGKLSCTQNVNTNLVAYVSSHLNDCATTQRCESLRNRFRVSTTCMGRLTVAAVCANNLRISSIFIFFVVCTVIVVGVIKLQAEPKKTEHDDRSQRPTTRQLHSTYASNLFIFPINI